MYVLRILNSSTFQRNKGFEYKWQYNEICWIYIKYVLNCVLC